MSSVSSKQSADADSPWREGCGWPDFQKGQKVGRHPALKSAYEDGNKSQDYLQKENIRPRFGGLLTTENKGEPDEPNSRSIFAGGPSLLRKARSNLSRRSPPLPTSQGASQTGPKWDPTFVPSSKPTQDDQRTVIEPFGQPDRTKYGFEVSISGGDGKVKKATLVERAAMFGKSALPEIRPLWKGGSGRSGSVDTVTGRSLPQTRQLYTVEKNMKDKSKGLGATGSEEGLGDVGASPRLTLCGVRDKSLPLLDAQTPRIKEPTADKTGHKTPPDGESSPTHGQVTPRGYSASSSPPKIGTVLDEVATRTSIESDDSTATVAVNHMDQSKSHFSWSTYAESVIEAARTSHTEVGSETRQKLERDPVSRFSWSTVATNTTYREDCSPPDVPPSPTIDVQQPPSPIMMRRRPVRSKSSMSSMSSQPVSDIGKTEAGTTPTLTSIDSKRVRARFGDSLSPTSEVDKALPPPPAMNKESTRIEALQAKSDELDLRQSNLRKATADLQKIEHASPMEVTAKMRKDNNKKLEQVGAALDEVQREKHDVGRALARARLRVAREEGEASSIWLRRVTG